MIDAFHIAASQPWAIEPQALETVLAVANGLGDPEALQARLGRRLDNTRKVVMRNGVAVIPVTGPIFRYANLFTEISGATSTGVLALDIRAALDNDDVRAIVLEFDSPGGQVAGINELAKLIHTGSKRKRIVAYGESAVTSGAYWLAAAASEIVVDETAYLGSIGVVGSYQDTRKRDEKADVRTVDIVSSQSPDKRIDPNTDEGRAKVQAQLDRLADVFVAAIAGYRKTSVDKVLSDFGRGDILIGKYAIRAGMADRIGSLESVIAELSAATSASGRKRGAVSGSDRNQVSYKSQPASTTATKGFGVHGRGSGGVLGRGAGGGGGGRGLSDSEWLAQVMRVAAGGPVDSRCDQTPLRHVSTVENKGRKAKRKKFWDSVMGAYGRSARSSGSPVL